MNTLHAVTVPACTTIPITPLNLSVPLTAKASSQRAPVAPQQSHFHASSSASSAVEEAAASYLYWPLVLALLVILVLRLVSSTALDSVQVPALHLHPQLQLERPLLPLKVHAYPGNSQSGA